MTTLTLASLRSPQQPHQPGQPGQPSQPKPVEARGHDAILRVLQSQRTSVTVMLMSGERLTGTVVGRDKYTITLLCEGKRHIIYKHSIEWFTGD